MRNASSEYKEALKQDSRNYITYADIKLRDGTILKISNEDLWKGGFAFEDSVSSSDSFDVGSAIVNKFTLTLNNIDEKYSGYDFEGAEGVVFVAIALEGMNAIPEPLKDSEGQLITDHNGEQIGAFFRSETERIRICTGYISDSPKEVSSIIALSFFDNMSKFDKPYSKSKLVYPATLNQIVRDACSECDVSLQTVSFPHDDFIVKIRPNDEAITFREIISWCAQIAGCFCRCDVYGRLELKWFDKNAVHQITSNYSAPQISVSDVIITGVRVVEKNESDKSEEKITIYQSGEDGYVISIEENELIKNGAGQTVAGWLGEKLVGYRFRKASVSHASDPTIEAGDIGVLQDRKGNKYNIVISSTKFSTGSGQSTQSSAESKALNSAARYSSSTKNYVDLQNGIAKEKTEREKALEELANRLETSPGVFTTVETDTGGGKIYYLHNKPKLSDSDMVWKMTAEAWAVSTDGGKTWNAGMTVDGDTIVRILTATGVNADWINTGAITVRDSNQNIIFSVDMDTKKVIISGDAVSIGGRPISGAINDAISQSQQYADKALGDYADTVSKELSSIQEQVDGQINDWYFDYEPSMQNYPASEWTTTEERRKHIGDRFFWKSKGYAYRFMENNGIWGWTLLQDTDITKAMQAAANAQDTADGKRRVFVTTPQPPYDIGDLWTNGQDILTATVAREQGGVYVSSDWRKLNNYTDDTVANQALEEARKAHNIVMQLDNEYQGIPTDWHDTVANQALEEARKAHNIVMQLDNEYQGIPTDWQGNITSFPNVQTTVQVFYGHQDVSASCTYSINKSSGITGSWNNYLRTYTVTALSTDTGWVDITANYMGIFDVTKRFNISKNKGGQPGENGADGIGIRSITSTDTGWVDITANYMGIFDVTKRFNISKNKGGQPGENGADGIGIRSITEYFATSADITANYMGIFDVTKRFNISKNKGGQPGENGADGIGIRSITEYFATSASSTYAPSSWYTTPQQTTETYRYLWNYERIYYSNGQSLDTEKRIIGVHGISGSNGSDGKGIKQVTNYYLATYRQSGVTTSTYGWTTSPQNTSTYNRYLWNYEVITYTDNTTHTVEPHIIGTHGQDGNDGQDGSPGRTYFIEVSANVLKKGKNSVITPSSITAYAYYRDGNSATRYSYSGRWQVQTSTNGSSFSTVLTSSYDETSKTYSVGSLSNSIVAIRFVLYASGGTSTKLDMQSIPIVLDAASLTKDDLLDIITDNGAWQGFYKGPDNRVYISFEAARGGLIPIVLDAASLTKDDLLDIITDNGAWQGFYKGPDNRVYISFEAARGGLMKLGGKNNGDGRQEIFDSRGRIIGRLDNLGLTFYYDYLTYSNYKSYKGVMISKEGIGYVQGSLYNDGTSVIISQDPVISFNSNASGMDADFDKFTANELTVYKSSKFNKPPQLFNLTHVSSGGHLVFASDGSTLAYLSSSSQRYKDIKGNISDSDIDEWYKVSPVWAKYKDGYLAKSDNRNGKYMPMFIAEDVEEHIPIATNYLDGKVEDWNERIMIPAMFAMIKSQKSEIELLKSEIKEIKNMIKENKNA